MSLINKEISDFSAQAYQNGEFRTVTKQDVLGKWSLFFFYPADFTFVCPTELEDLQNKYAEFKAAGCEVYSVSTDTHFVHKAWHDHSERISKITYPMLADPTHALSRDFEVYIEENGLAERGSFIVNPEGKIVVYEVNAETWAAMPMNFSAGFRPASLWRSTATRSAPPSGSPEPRPSSQALTLWVCCNGDGTAL